MFTFRGDVVQCCRFGNFSCDAALVFVVIACGNDGSELCVMNWVVSADGLRFMLLCWELCCSTVLDFVEMRRYFYE